MVRLFAGPGRYLRLDDLGLPAEVRDALSGLLDETSGRVILSGPAGSGKTTTIYACLRELVARTGGEPQPGLAGRPDRVGRGRRGPVAGEPGSRPDARGRALKALLRQDPEVIAIGEIRDRTTAEIALQAALTGHLTLTTFHAGSACEVVGRLLDMGLEPYAIRSGLRAVVAQRLVRRLCEHCSVPAERPEEFLGLPVKHARSPRGCPACGHTGYRGRMVLAELLLPDSEQIGQAILARADVHRLEELALEAGMISRWERACRAVEEGLTSPGEVRRVLGVSTSGTSS